MICEREAFLSHFSSARPVGGLTHNYYRYPARFSPEFARATILEFTNEGDCVLDAFMGGGTTIVEAVANGRDAIGVDINPLAHFITTVKTTPLSRLDKETIMTWAEATCFDQTIHDEIAMADSRFRNIDDQMRAVFVGAVSTLSRLEFPRQRRFARCSLLQLGQWAIDCRQGVPSATQMKKRFLGQVVGMLEGLDEFVRAAKEQGLSKKAITSRRKLHTGTIDDAIKDGVFSGSISKPQLVLTSPPYPGVHVLYHRWQVGGRRETPAPFWLADLKDGHGASYYTLGSRSRMGLDNYFAKLTDIFSSVRRIIDAEALVVQLVAFSEPDTQLPAYLAAMRLAGYEELTPLENTSSTRPVRKVPNRKWYTRAEVSQHASNEILLFHRPLTHHHQLGCQPRLAPHLVHPARQ